jgi:hypothetical protein
MFPYAAGVHVIFKHLPVAADRSRVENKQNRKGL